MHQPRFRFPFLPLLLLCLLGSVAYAAVDPTGAPPAPDTDAAEWLKAIYAAVTSKAWGTVAGLALIGLVYPLRRFGPNVLKTPFGGLVLAFLISLAGTLGIALAAGAGVSLGLVFGALSTAATAAGVWEWLKAHIPGVESAAAKAVAPVQTPTIAADPGSAR